MIWIEVTGICIWAGHFIIYPAKCINLICTENNSDKRNLFFVLIQRTIYWLHSVNVHTILDVNIVSYFFSMFTVIYRVMVFFPTNYLDSLQTAICDFDIKIKIGMQVCTHSVFISIYKSKSVNRSITGIFWRYYEKCNILLGLA